MTFPPIGELSCYYWLSSSIHSLSAVPQCCQLLKLCFSLCFSYQEEAEVVSLREGEASGIAVGTEADAYRIVQDNEA